MMGDGFAIVLLVNACYRSGQCLPTKHAVGFEVWCSGSYSTWGLPPIRHWWLIRTPLFLTLKHVDANTLVSCVRLRSISSRGRKRQCHVIGIFTNGNDLEFRTHCFRPASRPRNWKQNVVNLASFWFVDYQKKRLKTLFSLLLYYFSRNSAMPFMHGTKASGI